MGHGPLRGLDRAAVVCGGNLADGLRVGEVAGGGGDFLAGEVLLVVAGEVRALLAATAWLWADRGDDHPDRHRRRLD